MGEIGGWGNDALAHALAGACVGCDGDQSVGGECAGEIGAGNTGRREDGARPRRWRGRAFQARIGGLRLLGRRGAGAGRHRGRRDRHRAGGTRPARARRRRSSRRARSSRARRVKPRRLAAPPRCCPSRRSRRCGSCAPTTSRPRARASSTSRRARPRASRRNPIVGMTLENDQGPGTAFISARHDEPRSWTPASTCSTATCSSSRRGRAEIRVTSTHRRQATGNVSKWLEDVTPLDGHAGLPVGLRRATTRQPLQAYARFEEIAQQYPDDRRDRARSRTRPTATSARRRRRSAGPARPRSSMSSAAWGHEGGNGITVEFVNRPGTDLPAQRRGQRQGRPRPAGQERDRRAGQHRGAGRGRDRGGLAGPDRPRAPVPHQRRHGHRAGDDGPGRADRLPRRRSAPARPRAKSRAARSRCARCGSASSATAPSRAC